MTELCLHQTTTGGHGTVSSDVEFSVSQRHFRLVTTRYNLETVAIRGIVGTCI